MTARAMPFAGLLRRLERRKEIPATWARPAMPEVPNQWNLSPMECAVMELVIQGKSNQEIAQAMCMANRTAAAHIRRVQEKMGVDNKMAAALKWAQRGSDSVLFDGRSRLVNSAGEGE